MGANYYLTLRTRCRPACAEHCKGPVIHLGKASAGWAFVFRAYPLGVEGVTGPVMTYEQWAELLKLDGHIADDAGNPVSPVDLVTLIGHHSGGRVAKSRKDFTDAAGRVFVVEEFT